MTEQEKKIIIDGLKAMAGVQRLMQSFLKEEMKRGHQLAEGLPVIKTLPKSKLVLVNHHND